MILITDPGDPGLADEVAAICNAPDSLMRRVLIRACEDYLINGAEA